MPLRTNLFTFALLAGPAFGLAACATAPAVQPATAVASPPAARPQARVAQTRPRVKRPDADCKVARVNLSSERKEALFRQFASELGGTDPAAASTPDAATAIPATTSSPPDPTTNQASAAAADCRQVER